MKIVLSTIGTIGDVIPFARLTDRLLSRGHAVTIHSWAQFATWFSPRARFEAIAESVSAEELDEMLDAALREASASAQKRRFARTFYGLGDTPTRARAGYARAREVFPGHDLAVINVLDHVGQLAADDVGVPWASYASRPPPPIAQADPLNADVDDALSELLATVTGISRRVRMFRERSPLLAFAACSPELLPEELRTVVEATGPWFARSAAPDPLPAALEAFVAAGDCMFVTFGTMPDVFDRSAALVTAAATSGWRAIVQVLPPHAPPTCDSEQIFVLRERVAFDALVPRVAAVAHHGSVGTAHEVVRAGKPALVVPHMGDQFFWARALHERGLGPSAVKHFAIDPRVLAARMTELRAPRYAASARALAPVIDAQDGVGRAVERIEAMSS